MRKWGFRKYGGEAQAEVSGQLVSNSVSGPFKRSPPATVRSRSNDPDSHVAKRQMLLQPIEFKDPFHGLGLPFDTIDVDEHHVLSYHCNDYCAPALNDFEEWTKGQRPFNDPDAESLHIDFSQNIDDFSCEKIYEMKRAADFLAATRFRKDAFALYVLILKRLRTSSRPDWMITWTTIACARTASTDAQMEIARALLNQRLAETPGSAPLVTQFVMRMLLADTYALKNDRKMERFHIEIAVNTPYLNHLLLTHLPHEHRSFDLWAYYFLTRRCSFRCGDDHVVYESLRESMPYCHEVDQVEAQNMFLSQKPGLFEIENGIMSNPCLRSCLLWATHETKHLDVDHTLWDKMNNIKIDDALRYYMIFYRLWECLHSDQTLSKYQLPWLAKAEKLMGISASELLRLVVMMILCYEPVEPIDHLANDRNLPGQHFARHVHAKACRLVQESDRTLAEIFLHTVTNYEKFVLRQASSDFKIFKSVIHEYAKKKLEKGLKLILPEIVFNTFDGRYQHGPRRVTPSCASIPTDSDLSSFRALRNRIEEDTRTFGYIAEMTRPSSGFRQRSLDTTDLLDMDDLSSALQSVSLDSSSS